MKVEKIVNEIIQTNKYDHCIIHQDMICVYSNEGLIWSISYIIVKNEFIWDLYKFTPGIRFESGEFIRSGNLNLETL